MLTGRGGRAVCFLLVASTALGAAPAGVRDTFRPCMRILLTTFGTRGDLEPYLESLLDLMADGAVRYVNDSVDPNVWTAAGSRNGEESVGLPD